MSLIFFGSLNGESGNIRRCVSADVEHAPMFGMNAWWELPQMVVAGKAKGKSSGSIEVGGACTSDAGRLHWSEMGSSRGKMSSASEIEASR